MPNVMTNDELNTALENRPSDFRITPDYIKSRIASTSFSVMEGETVTICSIKIDNGFSVRGESACVDPANFDAEIGKKIAYDNAFRQLWPLFGFALAETRVK